MKQSVVRTVVLACATCAMAVAVAGCSMTHQQSENNPSIDAGYTMTSTTQADSQTLSEREDLVVDELNWIPDEFGSLDIVAIVENPNDSLSIRYPEVKFVGKDAEGNTVFTKDSSVDGSLGPGEAGVVTASEYDNADKVATVECTPKATDDNDWDFYNEDFDEILNMTATVTSATNEDGDVKVLGTVTNGNEDMVDSAYINIVLRNDSGAIVGTVGTVVSKIPAGATEDFEASTYGMSEFSSHDIYLTM